MGPKPEFTRLQALQIELESAPFWQSYASKRGKIMSKVTTLLNSIVMYYSFNPQRAPQAI